MNNLEEEIGEKIEEKLEGKIRGNILISNIDSFDIKNLQFSIEDSIGKCGFGLYVIYKKDIENA